MFVLMIMLCLGSCKKPVEKTCEEDSAQEKCQTLPAEKTCVEDPTQEKCKEKETSVLNVITNIPMGGLSLWRSSALSSSGSSAIIGLLYGYNTVVVTKEGKYQLDSTVVKSFSEVKNVDGGKTFTIEIHDDLKWSDGTGITAKDYVGSILLFSNRIHLNANGILGFAHFSSYSPIINGGNEYYADESGLAEFKGVDLLDEYRFSLTIDGKDKTGDDNFPYYYEKAYCSVRPEPMHIILPGVEIVQGEQGAKFTSVTTEELKEIIEYNINPGKDNPGYMKNPKVSCGPYKLEEIDLQGGAIVIKNEYYKGNYEGQKPSIETIVFKYVEYDNNNPDLLYNGDVDIIYNMANQVSADVFREIVENKYDISATRIDYGSCLQINFHSDHSPTRFVEVRQAISYLLNRDEMVNESNENYNTEVIGIYLPNCWMAQKAKSSSGGIWLVNEKDQKVCVQGYEFNSQKATELVESVGYIYGDEACTKYFTIGDEVRYRINDDGTTEPLIIDWSCNEMSNSTEILKSTLVPAAAKIGLKINAITTDSHTILYRDYYGNDGDGYEGDPSRFNSFEELLASYNQGEEQDKRVGSMFVFSKSFRSNTFVPIGEYDYKRWGWDGGVNISYFYSEELEDCAMAMATASSDDEYYKAWQKYQYYYYKCLPSIPLYSSYQYAFFNNRIVGFKDTITSWWNWTDQVLYCTIRE